MANIFLNLLFAHWLTFFDALQRFFWNYTPQPLLSTVFAGRIEDSSKFSPIVHVPQFRDPLDHVNSVDFATSCLLPTIFQTPLTMNFYCTPDYGLHDVTSAASSHYYAFSDVPVWRLVDLSADAAPPPHVEDDYVQSNIVPYGARGLSFCPVLVGIIYVHSLLHLYMLLMIPSLFSHWFEDVLVYESLDPRGLLDCSWVLHASLWTAPWRLLRYGMHMAIPCGYRRVRRSTHKSVHSPIPSIVLIRVDGEAVPVTCAEDHHDQVKASAAAAKWSPSLESANLDVGDGRAVASESEEPFFVFGGDDCIATELAMRATSHQGEVAKADVSLTVANEVPDQRLGNFPVLVQTEKPPQEDVLILSIPNTPIVTTGDSCDVNKRTDNLEHMASLKSVTNGVCQDSTDSLGEHPAFSPWGLGDNQAPNGMQTSTEIATGLSMGSQDISTTVKNVQFVICDDARAALADPEQVSSSTSHTEEQPTCAWTHQLGDDGATVGSAQMPAVPFDLTTEASKPEQATQPVPSAVFDEKEAETTQIELVQPLSPFLSEKLVVNLPSLVTRREDLQFVDMVPMVLAALIEDVATRSPHQTFCPTVPTVALNMKYIVEAKGQGLHPSRTEELVQDASDLNDKAAAYGTLNIASARGDGSYPPTPSIGNLDPAFSPIADTELPLCDVWTPIILSTSATICDIGMSVTKADDDTSRNTVIELPGMNELEGGVSCETSLYSAGGNLLAKSRSLQDGPQGPDVSDFGTPIHLSAFSESPKEPETPNEANVVDPGRSDSMTIAPSSSRSGGSSCAAAIELATTRLSEVGLASPCKETSPLSMTSTEKKTGEIDDENSRETNTELCNPASTVSKPAPERTLSGSIHAPSEHLQPANNIDRTPVSYGTPPLLTDSVLLAEAGGSGVRKSTTTRNGLERRQDLFASIHAPQRISKAEVRSPVSQFPDEIHCGHRRSTTNSGIVSDRKPVIKPYSPNWEAMPDVVDAFRMFKEAPTRRRVSSIAGGTNRTPMVGVVGTKGIATSSLNSTTATANIHNHWMQGNDLLLVRGVVSSDPADFDLRTCTNLKTSKIHSMMNARPEQRVLCPGVSSFELQDEITLPPVPVNTHLSSMGVQRQQGYHIVAARFAGGNRANVWFPKVDGLPGMMEPETKIL